MRQAKLDTQFVMSSPTQSASSQAVKKLEKEIAQEGKTEHAHVHDVKKDLSAMEKAQLKAHKVAQKAESAISKMSKKETAATAAMHKATHDHDIAASHLHDAEKEAELKRQQDIKLQHELDAKKGNVEAAIKEQEMHDQAREAKLAELHGGASGHGAHTAEAATAGAGVAAMTEHGHGPIAGPGARGGVGGASIDEIPYPSGGPGGGCGYLSGAGMGGHTGAVGGSSQAGGGPGAHGMAPPEGEIPYPSGGPGGGCGHNIAPPVGEFLYPSGGPGGGCGQMACADIGAGGSKGLEHLGGEGSRGTPPGDECPYPSGGPGGGYRHTGGAGAGGTGGHQGQFIEGDHMVPLWRECPYPSGGPGGDCRSASGEISGSRDDHMARSGAGGRGGAGVREFVGGQHVNMEAREPGDMADFFGGVQRSGYHGTGIGREQGIGEEQGYGDDHMNVGGPGGLGGKVGETGGAIGGPTSGETMPGSYGPRTTPSDVEA
ncbi:hypothetical protein D9615_000035 [Tricholomella constricta]|uniref:Uncharacterized protein n=1 Tax=Tricholomella constricta TaxID=117010 RepID=A0A8H5MC07_9AGAR|nr:hypothetical protein D9615_000035 [Tricholomella constricta]